MTLREKPPFAPSSAVAAPAAYAVPAGAPRPARPMRTATLLGVRVLATGSHLPERVVTNADLASLGCDSEWIVRRTGIRERRHVAPHEATSDLCAAAARRCLAEANVDPGEVDLLVVGTFTPDMSFPSTACLVQDMLGLNCGAMDVQAACSGFMYALAVGAQFVHSGSARRCLVIGGDANSRVVNPADVKTYPLFGDGAGAVLLGPADPDAERPQGLLAYHLGADGSGGDLLCRKAGGSRRALTPAALAAGEHFMAMEGKAVFRWAVQTVAESIHQVLDHAGLTVEDIDLFIPHQANIRIIDEICRKVGLAEEKAFNNLDRYGNTSGGSIPIALDEAVAAGRVREGDRILMTGFGAGLTWGTAIFSW